MFKNIRIGTRLAIVFCCMILITLVLSMVTINYMKRLSDFTYKLYRHPFTVSTTSLKIDTNIVRMHRSMKDIILLADHEAIEAEVRRIAEYEREVYGYFDIVLKYFLGDKRRVEAARRAFADWKPIREEVIALMRAGDVKKAGGITRGKGARHVAFLYKTMQEFIDFAQEKADSFLANAEKSKNRAFFITYLAFVFSVMAGIVFALVTTRSITGPLGQGVTFTDAIARGDLEADIHIDQKDEVGFLASSLNEMKGRIKDVLAETDTLVRAVQEGELDKRGNAEAFAGGWRELVLGVNNLIEAFVEPINMTSHHIDRISKGDVPERITVDYRGDFNLIRNNLNVLTDTTHEIAQLAEKVAEGDLKVVGRERSERDKLMQAINLMIKTMDQVTTVADAVASGDYSRSVEIRGERDLLGKAINRMTMSLQEMTGESRKEDWLKTGQNELNERMRGEQDEVTLTRNILNFLADYLNLQVGVCYLVSGESRLRLVSSYAYLKRGQAYTEFQLGEGLIGQAALERKNILYTRLPEGYDHLTVNFGVGESVPRNLFIMPLVHEEKLLGVLALGTTGDISDMERELLDRVADNMVIAVNSAQSRVRMGALLEQTEKQSKELQNQQEELKASNEELEEQTRILRASEEKLKEQSEELQAINEELEEKTESLKRQKDEVERKNREVEASKEEIGRKARELELAGKYKSEFLANMSHELRTPLNSLLLLAKMLADNEEGNLTDDQVASARVIHGGGKDLLNLINDILDLSKIEAGKMDVVIEEVSIDSILSNFRDQFAPVAKEKGLDFRIETSKELPPRFKIDGRRVEQILKNLLSNAFKFTEQGHVALNVRFPEPGTRFFQSDLTPERAIAFSVRDTGIGIPEEKRNTIFEAFHQADGTTSRRYGGTGLGLTISRELAKNMGGEIQIRSREGEGSDFILFLPLDLEIGLLREEEPFSPPLLSPVEEGEISDAPLSEFIPDDREEREEGKPSILVIEDDINFARALMGIVHKKGYRFLAAGDGKAGLKMASQYRPDAIVLDIVLPDMSGLSVLDRLKADLETRHIPVHVISGHDVSADSLKKGAIGYLTKPASPEEIDEVFTKFESLLKRSLRELLVVEDDMGSQRAIARLVENKGVHITAVASGKEAIEKVGARRFDCVILDLGLPDMSGFELLGKLEAGRASDAMALPPIIIYTGRELTREEHRELSRYARSIVVKGVASPERLLDEVSLFLHSVESAMPESQKKMIRMLHDPEKVLEGKKILLVDDDMRNMFALSNVLGKYGFKVVMADNGQMALEKMAGEGDIDLVLMDVMMPVMDGYEATRRIRSQERFDHIPVIALTAKAMPEDRARCIEAGANDYLMKPVDPERLISMLRIWLFESEKKA